MADIKILKKGRWWEESFCLNCCNAIYAERAIIVIGIIVKATDEDVPESVLGSSYVMIDIWTPRVYHTVINVMPVRVVCGYIDVDVSAISLCTTVKINVHLYTQRPRSM